MCVHDVQVNGGDANDHTQSLLHALQGDSVRSIDRREELAADPLTLFASRVSLARLMPWPCLQSARAYPRRCTATRWARAR